jgi:hypothetical protein
MRKRLKLVPLLLILAVLGCQKKIAIHPGAISNLDSYTYDVLLVEQDVLQQAKTQYLTDQLPQAAKEPLNYAINQYNVTQVAWQAYHGGAGDATKLQEALSALVAAVGEVQRVIKPVKATPIPGGVQ